MSQNNPYAPQENSGQQPNPYGAPPSTGQPDPSMQQGQNGQFSQQPYGQQPYTGAPNYGQQQYTQPYGGAQQPTSGLAIAALASGIAGWTVLPFIGAIAAIILGHMGLGDVKKNNKAGRGLAITGLVLGYVAIVLTILAVVGFVALVQSDPTFFDGTYESTY